MGIPSNKPSELGMAKLRYTAAHHDLCEENKHDIELLELILTMDRYVILLEELVNNLSDPTENFWNE